MLTEIKKCADAQDIKGLRYIFADCLDVDPTFEKYRESYEFCKEISGLFEPHRELNGIMEDQRKWSREYWDQLKMDLMKNFSQIRFEHMIQVAKVVYVDKIERLLKERETTENQTISPKDLETCRTRESNTITNNIDPMGSQIIHTVSNKEKISEEELQKKKIREQQEQLRKYNESIEKKQNDEKKRIEESRKLYGKKSDDLTLKKFQGIVIGIIAVVIVVLLIKILR